MEQNPQKFTAEIELAATPLVLGEYVQLAAVVEPFVRMSSSFPVELRERLAEELLLDSDEIEEAAVAASQTIAVREKEDGDLTDEEKKVIARSETGKLMFSKVNSFLIDARLKGEMPEEIVTEAKVTANEIKDAADSFIRLLQPLLVSDGKLHAN
jgi:hypothetical protein